MKSITRRAPQKSYSSPRLNKLTPEKAELLLQDSAAQGNEKATELLDLLFPNSEVTGKTMQSAKPVTGGSPPEQ